MKKQLQVFSIIVLTLGFFYFLVPNFVMADACSEAGGTGLACTPVKEILEGFLYWLLKILASIAVVGFMISGGMYLLSGGNEKMIENAKKSFFYSVIGVIVALSGFVIIKAVDNLLRAKEF